MGFSSIGGGEGKGEALERIASGLEMPGYLDRVTRSYTAVWESSVIHPRADEVVDIRVKEPGGDFGGRAPPPADDISTIMNTGMKLLAASPSQGRKGEVAATMSTRSVTCTPLLPLTASGEAAVGRSTRVRKGFTIVGAGSTTHPQPAESVR